VVTPIQFEHQAGIEPASPAWKAGSSATRTLVRSSERPPGIEPGPSGWRPDVQPRTPWAQQNLRVETGTRTRMNRFCGLSRNRTPLLGFGDQAGPRPQPNMWSLRALPPAPPHCQRGVLPTELRPHLRGGNRSQRHGSTLRPRPQCARSESNQARPLIERLHDLRATGASLRSVGQDGWICPSGLRFPKPALIYPSSTLKSGHTGLKPDNRPHAVRSRTENSRTNMCPASALVWNRTSTSWASARRHHQIGYKGIVVAGVVPGHGHRRLFDCQRAISLRHEAVRGRGFEPRRAGSKPAGLPLADPRSVSSWASGDSNPARSGKSRVLRHQSFWPA
jgi:hypothetical protein